MTKLTVESLKKHKEIDKKIDALADIMAEGFYGLDNKIEGVRTELKGEIGGLRTEFHEFRTETRSEFSSIRAELRSIKQNISEIKKRLEYVYEKAMECSDILVEDIVKLQTRVKKLEKQVAYLQTTNK